MTPEMDKSTIHGLLQGTLEPVIPPDRFPWKRGDVIAWEFNDRICIEVVERGGEYPVILRDEWSLKEFTGWPWQFGIVPVKIGSL